MLSDWRVVRGFNRNIWIFLSAWGLAAFGYFGIQGVLLNLYLLRLGFGPEFIGLLIASGQIIWAILALPAGAVGRQLGLRAALVTGYTLSALGIGLLLLVETLPQPMWSSWLYGCWMLMWVGVALNTVNSIPYLMSVSSAEERNHAFSAQGAVIALMAFMGSLLAGLLPGLFITLLGGSLDQPAPYRHALWLSPLMFLLCALLWTRAQPARLLKQGAAVSSSPRPYLGLFIFLGLIVFLPSASEGALRAFFNVYLDTALNVPLSQIGTIFAVGQLLPVVIAVMIPQLLRRWGTPLTLSLSAAGVGLAMLPLIMLSHWLPAALGFMGVVAMMTVNAPARNIFSQEITPEQWRTTTSAIVTIGLALGWASSAAFGGYIITSVGFKGLFVISAVLAGVAAIALWVYARLPAKRV